MNKKLLTSTEKTIAVLDEVEKFIAKLEEKYNAKIKYNVDEVKDLREKKGLGKRYKRG